MATIPWVVCTTSLNPTPTPTTLLDIYRKHQILLVRNFTSSPPHIPPLTALSNAYHQASPAALEAIHTSWQVETKSLTKDILAPRTVLGQSSKLLPSSSWYCSFVAQGDEQLLARVTNLIPAVPFLEGHRQGNAAWVFIGKRSHQSFSGRSEHVDRVLHDGTYHIQCEGSKTWKVRPNWAYRDESSPLFGANGAEEGCMLPVDSAWRTEEQGMEIQVQQGDLLMVNTRLWAHMTTIPKVEPAEDVSSGKQGAEAQTLHMSISIARDFYLQDKNDGGGGGGGSGNGGSGGSGSSGGSGGSGGSGNGGGTNTNTNKRKKQDSQQDTDRNSNTSMGNVDTLFSSRFIAKGEVVFTESEFAKVATSGTGLAMSSPKDANCDVVRLEDGSVVIMALRNIRKDEIIMLADPSYEEEEEEAVPPVKKRK